MSVTATTTTKSPQRARLACAAATVACTVAAGAYALAPDDTRPQSPSTTRDAVLTSTGLHDLQAVKARNMRALGLTASTGPYNDLEANKARSMRALGAHLMARGKPISGRELAGYKARSMRALGAHVISG